MAQTPKVHPETRMPIDGELAAASGTTSEDVDPQGPDVVMGPLISATQRDRVMSYVEGAEQGSATLALGGSKPAHLDTGFLFEPTLFTDVDDPDVEGKQPAWPAG